MNSPVFKLALLPSHLNGINRSGDAKLIETIPWDCWKGCTCTVALVIQYSWMKWRWNSLSNWIWSQFNVNLDLKTLSFDVALSRQVLKLQVWTEWRIKWANKHLHHYAYSFQPLNALKTYFLNLLLTMSDGLEYTIICQSYNSFGSFILEISVFDGVFVLLFFCSFF